MKQTPRCELDPIIYTGSSMNPLLRVGDRLHVVPYCGGEVRPGDVIVFPHPGGAGTVVHRVVSVDLHGIQTQGDNNRQPDPWRLDPSAVAGRAISAERGGRKIRIYRGPLGRLFSVAVRAVLTVDAGTSHLLHPLYHRLSRPGVFRKWLLTRLPRRILCFDRPGGRELQVFLGPYLAGRRLPGADQWQIRRPFRLFLDTRFLTGCCPHPPAQGTQPFHMKTRQNVEKDALNAN
jgi:signal peptidase